MKKQISLILLCFVITACAKTPADKPASAAANSTEPPPIASTDVVKATPQEATITRGQSVEIILPIKITSGYHINANPASFPYLIPVELRITPANGIGVEFIRYPDPLTKSFSFAETPLKVYEGDTLVKASLNAGKAAQTGRHNLSAKLRVQACDDKVCYAPGEIDLTLPVDVK